MLSSIFSNIPGVASLAIIFLAVAGTGIAFVASAFYGRTLDAQTWNLLLLIDGTAIGLVTGQGIGASRALRTLEMNAAAQSETARANMELAASNVTLAAKLEKGREAQYGTSRYATTHPRDETRPSSSQEEVG